MSDLARALALIVLFFGVTARASSWSTRQFVPSRDTRNVERPNLARTRWPRVTVQFTTNDVPHVGTHTPMRPCFDASVFLRVHVQHDASPIIEQSFHVAHILYP